MGYLDRALKSISNAMGRKEMDKESLLNTPIQDLKKPLAVHSKIDTALEEINRNYQPGTLEWMKVNRPEEWEKMISLEDRINQAALRGNEEELGGALADYQILHMKWRGISKTPQGETLDLFGKSLILGKDHNLGPGENSCPE